VVPFFAYGMAICPIVRSVLREEALDCFPMLVREEVSLRDDFSPPLFISIEFTLFSSFFIAVFFIVLSPSPPAFGFFPLPGSASSSCRFYSEDSARSRCDST